MKFIKPLRLKNSITLVAILCVEIIVFNLNSTAQNFEAKIKLVSLSPARVSIEGRFLTENSSFKDWSFLQNYADVTNLGGRIENVQFFDKQSNPIQVKRLNSGEYKTNQNPISWKYEVKIGIPDKLTDAAHISWLADNQGLLMLEDLLPQINPTGNKLTARIILDFPADWKTSSSETLIGKGWFNVDEISQAVFLVGKNWREKTMEVGQSTLNFALDGNWQFSDDDALAMANSIFEEHQRTFGIIPKQKVQILLLPFPQPNTDADRWRAETRGSTVVVISGSIQLKSVAIQRLHEQLRHEIIHLWLPNALNLSGNYDWFYEGFAIYHALRTGVELNQIRFDDYLNTLGRAYDLADWVSSDGKSLSLIDASQKRWAGSSNYIYAKGLVTAFLCDTALLRASRGKRSLKDIFRELYQKHRRPNQIEDGNTAILNILKKYPELLPIINSYIEGTAKIDWQSNLEAVGIDFDGRRLSVKAKLDGRQKDLLNKLGYNQWLKLLEKKK